MNQPIPRGIEVLVKKASVDPEFRELLLRDRAAAAETIGLTLDPAETAMLATIPAEQLEAIVARTVVPPEQRRVFLGNMGAAMLTAIGVSAVLCAGLVTSAGSRARRRREEDIPPEQPKEEEYQRKNHPPTQSGGFSPAPPPGGC
jgi:hypothetical protein